MLLTKCQKFLLDTAHLKVSIKTFLYEFNNDILPEKERNHLKNL